MAQAAKAQNVPEVTVGLPIFNEEDRIADCLADLQRQTLTNFNIVVFDNCSTDRTAEIVATFAGDDPRIKTFRHSENVGIVRNFKAVLEACDTTYFKWLAADDRIDPQYLERCLAVFRKDPTVVAVQTGHIVHDDERELRRVDITNLSTSLGWRHVLSLVASKAKANYFIYGLFRTDVLREMYLHFEPMPSGDRWFLLGMPAEGALHYLTDHLHYRYQNPVTFAVRQPSDPLARSQRTPMLALMRRMNANLPRLNRSQRLHVNVYFMKWYARWQYDLFRRRRKAFLKKWRRWAVARVTGAPSR